MSNYANNNTGAQVGGDMNVNSSGRPQQARRAMSQAVSTGRGWAGQVGNFLQRGVRVHDQEFPMWGILGLMVFILVVYSNNETGNWMDAVKRVVMTPTFASMVIVAVSAKIAWSLKHMPVAAVASMTITFLFVFIGVRYALANGTPKAVTTTNMRDWGQLGANLESESGIQLGNGIMNAGYEQVSTDTQQWAVVAAPAQEVGGYTPAAPAPAAPVPTRDPALVAAQRLYEDMNMAVAQGNKVNAIANATALRDSNGLDQETYDRAQAVLDMVANADLKLAQIKANIPLDRGKMKKDGHDSLVRDLLMNGSYRIVDDGNKAGTWFPCNETARVEFTSGFLVGEQFNVTRCYLDQFGVGDTGDVFSVDSQS